MPGMDGLTLYCEIKKPRADTVAIIVTAYAGSGTAEEALAAGAWQMLPKPVDLPKLLGLVGTALEEPLILGFESVRSWPPWFAAVTLQKAGNAIVNLVGGREVHPINVRVGGPGRD